MAREKGKMLSDSATSLLKLGNLTLKAPNQQILRARLVVAEDTLGIAVTCVVDVSSTAIEDLADVPIPDASGGTKQRIQSLVKIKDFGVSGAVDRQVCVQPLRELRGDGVGIPATSVKMGKLQVRVIRVVVGKCGAVRWVIRQRDVTTAVFRGRIGNLHRPGFSTELG